MEKYVLNRPLYSISGNEMRAGTEVTQKDLAASVKELVEKKYISPVTDTAADKAAAEKEAAEKSTKAKSK